jgi:hypothetical protein
MVAYREGRVLGQISPAKSACRKFWRVRTISKPTHSGTALLGCIPRSGKPSGSSPPPGTINKGLTLDFGRIWAGKSFAECEVYRQIVSFAHAIELYLSINLPRRVGVRVAHKIALNRDIRTGSLKQNLIAVA